MVGPDLGIVDVVVLVVEVVPNNSIDFLLDKRTNVVKDSLLLVTHTF